MGLNSELSGLMTQYDWLMQHGEIKYNEYDWSIIY